MDATNPFELYGKYKDLYLFNTGKGSVLFKALSYADSETAKRICKNYPALAPIVEDNIWKKCVIEHTLPGTVDTLNAGLVSTIVRLILNFSNPTSHYDIENELNEIRAKTRNIREEIIIKICQAFPSYTPEDVEDMEWRTQLKRLAQAEKILGTTFNFVDNSKPTKAIMKGPAAPATKEINGQQFIDFEKENQVLNGA
jgi:hypothetical protein